MGAYQVLICQGKTCRKQRAAAVLAEFQAHGLSDVIVTPCGCLGQCGNGPMVLVLPDDIWYCRVRPDEVPAIIQRHLIQGKPIRAMLYPPFHPPEA